MLDNLKETLKHVKRNHKQGKYICPICGSSSIKVEHNFGWLYPSRYICTKCGYRGYLILEIDQEQPQQ